MGYVVNSREPIDLAINACKWISVNKDRWIRLLSLCEWFREQHPGRRLRRGDLWVYAQEKGLSVTLCDDFRFDNSLWSVLSRLAIMCKPNLADVIKPRLSRVDDLNLCEIWETFVGDPTCLVLDDWRESE